MVKSDRRKEEKDYYYSNRSSFHGFTRRHDKKNKSFGGNPIYYSARRTISTIYGDSQQLTTKGLKDDNIEQVNEEIFKARCVGGFVFDGCMR